jgi:Arc/MetJ family transcription regulator
MGRTNVVVDDELFREGLKLTKCKTKKELINRAIKELIKKEKRKKLLKLEGNVKWQGDLAEMRKRRV